MALLSMAKEWDQVAHRSIRSWIEKNYKHNVRIFYRDQAQMLARLLKRQMVETEVKDLVSSVSYWELWEETLRKGSNADRVLENMCLAIVQKKLTANSLLGFSGGKTGIMGQINSSGADSAGKAAAKNMYSSIWRNPKRVKQTTRGITILFQKGEFGYKIERATSQQSKKGQYKDVFRAALRVNLTICLNARDGILVQVESKINQAMNRAKKGSKLHSLLNATSGTGIDLKKQEVPPVMAGAHHGETTTHAMISFVKNMGPLLEKHLKTLDPIYWDEIEEYQQEMMSDIDFSRVLDVSTTKAKIKDNMTVQMKMSTKNEIWEGTDLPAIQEAVKKWHRKQMNRLLDDWSTGKIGGKAYAEKEGSTPMKDKALKAAARVAIKNMFPHKSRPNMKYKVNRALAKEYIDNAKGKKSISKSTRGKKSKGKSTQYGKQIAATTAAGRSRKAKSKREAMANASPVKLRNMINTLLPTEVARRMVSPRLQFRTGRFASSARVQQVREGPRGGMYADYTYMTNPYATFEPGGKMGDVQRDPKRIIETSIRSIMAKQMGSKFTGMRRI